MKFSTIIATFACVLGATLAFNEHKVAQAHSEFMSYINENMGGIKMMRGSSAHLVCYNDFIPQINSLAEEAKSNSQTCVDAAEESMGNSTTILDAARRNLTAEVEKIQDSLANCVGKPGSIEFLECLVQSVSPNKEILDGIGKQSSKLINEHGQVVQSVEHTEITCIHKAVDDAKRLTDGKFDELKMCLEFGPTTAAPQQF